MLLKVICLFLLFLPGVRCVSAAEPPVKDLTKDFLSERWTIDSGLPQNTVTSIVQTREGYLWIGTFGGLARFDGVRFIIFNTANTPALRSNRIVKVQEDQEATLWIGTENGDLVRCRSGKFEIFAENLKQANLSGLAFLVDRAGDLWVAQTDGLRHYRLKEGGEPEFYPQAGGFTSVAEDAKGKIWLGTNDGGLARLENGLILPALAGDKKALNVAPRLMPDGAGRLWALLSGRLGHFTDGGGFQSLIEHRLTPSRYLTGINADRHRQFWYGFYETIYKFGEDDRLLAAYDVSDLTGSGIRELYFDREDNLWIGTNGDGLIRLRPRQIKTLSTADGLPSDEILTVIEDPAGGRGGVWIGAVGLTHWQNGRVDAVYKMENGLPANRITALAFDGRGTLWIGTLGGLAALQDGRITYYPDGSKTEKPIRAIFVDRAGSLWIGREKNGLQRFRDGRFKTYGKTDGLISDDVRYISAGRSGDLLIGTAGGLAKAHLVCAGESVCTEPEKMEFTSLTTAEGLSNDFVRDIYEEDDGTLWLATYGGGLNRLRDGKVAAVTVKNGLGDDFISRILPDDRGNFWLLGNHGIYSVSRQSLRDLADGRGTVLAGGIYGTRDGLLSSEGNGGNQPSGWRMRDGTLWFAMIKGVAVIDPQMRRPPPPPVLIEESLLDGMVLAGDKDAKITIRPGRENLEIRFTALSLTKSENIKFRYRLEGLDSDWVNLDTRRAAYFPHLPPGNYRFIVTANTDGVWSDRPAALEITVLPPFWQTWWFLLAAVAAVIAVVAAGFQLRLGRLKRQRQVQEDFSRQLINAHEIERRRLASGLHDGLGQELLIIKNWAALGLASKPEAGVREHLEEISTTAGRALEEARGLARALRPFHLERFGLTKAIEYMAEQIEASAGLPVETSIAQIDDLFPPETEISIFRIVQECLNNAVKHARARRLEITVERETGAIRLAVIDDGHGFEPLKIEKNSFGLRGINERVNLLNGRLSIDSAPGRGTRMTITLPIPKSLT